MRGARGTPFEQLGSFANINDAAEIVCKIERADHGVIFFRVSVDTLREKPESDADVLSHLSYQGAARYYELTRSAQ